VCCNQDFGDTREVLDIANTTLSQRDDCKYFDGLFCLSWLKAPFCELDKWFSILGLSRG